MKLFVKWCYGDESSMSWCLSLSMFPPQRRTHTVFPLMMSFIFLAAARAMPAEPSTRQWWMEWRYLTPHY